MKSHILIGLIGIWLISCYDKYAAVEYAKDHWNNINHECGTYTNCSPYSYFGTEKCGYGSAGGGDCANFVSQCLLEGGHEKLKGHKEWCRGYPCGKEEVGARRLGKCLELKGWERTCGHLQPPPSNIEPGDVLIYHRGGCENFDAHATLIVEVDPIPKIACHSFNQYGTKYTYMQGTKPFYEWLHYPQ